MAIKIRFQKTLEPKNKHIILPVLESKTPNTANLDKATASFLKHALKINDQFTGKNGDLLTLTPPAKTAFESLTILGLGKASELNALSLETAGGKAQPALSKRGQKNFALLMDEKLSTKDLKSHHIAAHIANGMHLRSYDFNRYKSKSGKKPKTNTLETLTLIHTHDANTKAAYQTFKTIADGTFLARDLVNMPPNDLYPEAYAKIIKDELKPLGVDVEILDEKKMDKLGMGTIMAVGKGSERQPRMVIMRWNGLKGKKSKSSQPLGFVGKGVTFDTGGISLKPGAGMDEMKMDMGGSACVVGLMKTLASRKAKADVVAIVGLAENMPSSNAYRPGDILKSYSGKTVEVLNTDAEGRLVLADCLTYIQQKYDPQFIVDLATLTGAMMVALGHEYCGTFTNNDTLWKQMETSSTRTGEKLWRMPLDKVWAKEMESAVADLQNLGKSRYAGACTAAAFLEHFIDEKRTWAHMDIAGTAWRKSDQPTTPKYGTGFGVRVLNDMIQENYER